LIEFALAHKQIVMDNVDRKVLEQALAANQAAMGMLPEGSNVEQLGAGGGAPSAPAPSEANNPGMSGGMSRAMEAGEALV
jgi:hypothetical protein